MIYMLDTNILIYLMKNKPITVAERIAKLNSQDQLVMSFVTYAELLKGANGSNNPERALATIARLLQRISVLYPNAKTCEYYGEWANKLKRQGTQIGGNDLWIACHALSCNAILVTHNIKEFKRISVLNWQDWAE
ncbi:type II toxin-antitoxin system VapC family toxin [Caviibacterium pharyngocola]|uniref:Ribonuclease VapC n=1 Tax=Caviibacterium pharyngocola TaxID=28159 RepID=A0A2M8RVN7_9PAST|nr:type II toxin-antitoxin system VapC family toxin [Caviibacterium pharyngocola]PJG82947.1 ribonuclease VapC [Caviibacterium pharyngocola]